jgi:hypothetical protein
VFSVAVRVEGENENMTTKHEPGRISFERLPPRLFAVIAMMKWLMKF